MASQKDVQDLLRLLTTGRNKLPMMAAMGRVKTLQGANLRSISEIGASDLSTLGTALSDEKAAKSLLAACKLHLKSGDSTSGTKRRAPNTMSFSSKKQRSAHDLIDKPLTPAQLEASLELPQPSADEEAISKCTIITNRAPLVLCFAVVLLQYTMPEQPLSSRLSLGQALVSVNSKSKALSLGMEKGKSAEDQGWGHGQPKARVMGREISVLKRSGYQWREITEIEKTEGVSSNHTQRRDGGTTTPPPPPDKFATSGWTASSPVTLKQSRFIAHSKQLHPSSASAEEELATLFASNPVLTGASHNIVAWRLQSDRGIIESSDDDGETGGGRHLLGLLQAENVVNVLLVVTRWYGGVMLGTDRWRIMSQVSRDALSQRLRVSGILGQEALWGLDLEAMASSNTSATGGITAGMPIHTPEGARNYILKAFTSPPERAEGESSMTTKGKKKGGKAMELETEANLAMLLGALEMLFASWTDHVSQDELDRKAWGWYTQVRPDVASGIAGWGGKGEVKLADILVLRRKAG